MKLLLFAGADGPSLPEEPSNSSRLHFDAARGVLSTSAGGGHAEWSAARGSASSSSLLGLSQFFVADENGGVWPVKEVLQMNLQRAPPRPISDAQVAGVEFRNKVGVKIDARRAEYGKTYSKAAVKPTTMAQAAEKQQQQQQQQSAEPPPTGSARKRPRETHKKEEPTPSPANKKNKMSGESVTPPPRSFPPPRASVASSRGSKHEAVPQTPKSEPERTPEKPRGSRKR